jgi:hypothetical protein
MIRFGHELARLEQDADCVRATIRDIATDRYVVGCQYRLGGTAGGPWQAWPVSATKAAA